MPRRLQWFGTRSSLKIEEGGEDGTASQATESMSLVAVEAGATKEVPDASPNARNPSAPLQLTSRISDLDKVEIAVEYTEEWGVETVFVSIFASLSELYTILGATQKVTILAVGNREFIDIGTTKSLLFRTPLVQGTPLEDAFKVAIARYKEKEETEQKHRFAQDQLMRKASLRRDENADEHRQKILAVFKRLDINGSAAIHRHEWEQVMQYARLVSDRLGDGMSWYRNSKGKQGLCIGGETLDDGITYEQLEQVLWKNPNSSLFELLDIPEPDEVARERLQNVLLKSSGAQEAELSHILGAEEVARQRVQNVLLKSGAQEAAPSDVPGPAEVAREQSGAEESAPSDIPAPEDVANEILRLHGLPAEAVGAEKSAHPKTKVRKQPHKAPSAKSTGTPSRPKQKAASRGKAKSAPPHGPEAAASTPESTDKALPPQEQDSAPPEEPVAETKAAPSSPESKGEASSPDSLVPKAKASSLGKSRTVCKAKAKSSSEEQNSAPPEELVAEIKAALLESKGESSSPDSLAPKAKANASSLGKSRTVCKAKAKSSAPWSPDTLEAPAPKSKACTRQLQKVNGKLRPLRVITASRANSHDPEAEEPAPKARPKAGVAKAAVLGKACGTAVKKFASLGQGAMDKAATVAGGLAYKVNGKVESA